MGETIGGELSITTLLAIWGALLSTFLAGWAIYRELLDRGKVELTAFIGRVAGPGDGRTVQMGPPDERERDPEYLVVTLTNVGRRPVSLVTLWIQRAHGLAIVKADTLPVTLPEGDYRTQLVDASVVNDELRDVFCVDSRGKRWRLGRRRVKELTEGKA